MPRIELAQLLRPTTTPEQELLLEHFYTQFDNRSAANRQITNVEPLFYQGVIAGTEFLVYANTKIYLCYEIALSDTIGLNGSNAFCEFYNENNIQNFRLRNTIASYTGAAVNYYGIITTFNNFIFSRMGNAIYDYMLFNGYRITLI